jgi:hypothetical protein
MSVNLILRKNGMISRKNFTKAKKYTASCMCCIFKEDHWCLLYSMAMRNQDITTCKNFKDEHDE